MCYQKQCVKCGIVFGEGSGPDIDGRYSSGLCASCLKEVLTPLYRKRQTAEGNFD